jgi:hypothetical protein
MTSDFKEYALQVLQKSNITPDILIPVICLTCHNVRSIDKYVEYDDVQYTVKGHVMLHLMAKTAEMSEPISIYQMSDH